MVALAPNTSETSSWDVLETFPNLHSRAREVTTACCTEARYSKSLSRVEIWQVDLESCDGLESFTRDPIAYEGSEWNQYELFGSNSLVRTDPTGKYYVLPAPTQTPCGLKFSWLLDDATKPPTIDLNEFAECMKDELAKSADYKGAAKKCAKKLLDKIWKDPTEKSKEWLAYSGCCVAYKDKQGFNDGDPCYAGTPEGSPPGTKPKKYWDLGHGIPEDRPPKFSENCCQFRACVAGVRGLLDNKVDPFKYNDCLAKAAEAGLKY